MHVIKQLLLIVLFLSILTACNEDGSVKVGQVVPSLKTKTLADVGGDLSRITTYRYPDVRMYQMSLDEALTKGKPIVLEFATPGHCTVCDKQLQMMKALLVKYEKQVIFIHMDQYQNPEAFRAYKVLGDPWTYVIDTRHIVRFKSPGRLLYGELDIAIKKVLNGTG